MKKIKVISAILALSLCSGALAACNGSPDAVSSTDSPSSSQGSVPSSSTGSQAEAVSEYPIVTDGSVTLKYWVTLNNAASKYIESYADNPAQQEIEKKTGVHIEFIHPAIGQEKEQFNLMIVSGEYPDLVGCSNLYQGGEFQGMYDGVFVNLKDYIPKYAPDYYKLMTDDEEFYREGTDDNGDISAIYAYKRSGDPEFRRPLLHQNVLDKLSKEIPKTLADWEDLFAAMKTSGMTPYLLAKNGYDREFIGLHGTMAGTGNHPFFKTADGQIYYGQVLPEFKEYLELMSGWYEKGYISKDFTTLDSNQINTAFDTEQVGMFFGPIVANFNRGQTLGIEVVSAPYPRINENDQIHYNDVNIWPKPGADAQQVSVATTCKNIEAAVRYINYAYTSEGADFYNWGVEGINYDVKDGEKVYNDTMLRNEKFGTEEASYIYKYHFAPKWVELDVICHANLLKSPEALASRMKWSDDDKVDSENILPPYQRTTEEQELLTKTMTQINTYADEMVLKFITGAEPIENFDTFVSTIKSMGLDELLASEQNAYERYMTKKLG